jgi:hypothetical protein
MSKPAPPYANGFRGIVDYKADTLNPVAFAIAVDADEVVIIDADLARKLLPGLLALALNPPTKEAPA